jgi:hypothetical protein
VASARSSSLRSQPGYSARATTTAYRPPAAVTATLPSVPSLARDAQTPGYTERSWLGQQLGQLPNSLNANLTSVRATAQQQLAGYGGWKFRQDDPNTASREDLTLDFDGKAGPGEREKGAIKNEVNQGNARGMLESSFTNQNIGQAVQRLSLEAQAIATQYAQNINAVQNDYASQVAQITGQWVSLYGQDAAWLVANPPPAPPIPVDPNDEATWTEKEYATASPRGKVTYADFLKGRKSTSALAKEWDTTYNYGRRFGGQ